MNDHTANGSRFGHADLQPIRADARRQRGIALAEAIGRLVTATFFGIVRAPRPARPGVFEERDPAIAESIRAAAAMRRCVAEGLNR